MKVSLEWLQHSKIAAVSMNKCQTATSQCFRALRFAAVPEMEKLMSHWIKVSCSAAAVKPLDHGNNGPFPPSPIFDQKQQFKKQKEFFLKVTTTKIYDLYYPVSPWQIICQLGFPSKHFNGKKYLTKRCCLSNIQESTIY